MNERIRILLADDHTLVREAIAMQLCTQSDFDVVASVRTGREAVAKTRDLQPDVVILDQDLTEMDPMSAARVIFQESPSSKVLFLSDDDNAEPFFRSVSAGATGYLVKHAHFSDFLDAIHALAEGRSYIWPSLNGAILDRLRESSSFNPEDMGYSQLSEREREVLKLIAYGHPVRNIAERLVVSVSTVQSHRANLLEKLRLRSTVDLVRYAIRLGLIDP